MPRVTPARPDAHAPHGFSDREAPVTWCLPCYSSLGSLTLAADPVAESICDIHAAAHVSARDAAANAAHGAGGAAGAGSTDPASTGTQTAAQGLAGAAGRGPRGRRARTERRAAARVRTKTEIREAAVRRAREKRAGRVRAAARLERGEFAPHPGWRNFIPPGWRVITGQAEARQVVQTLIDDQPWRAERATSWSQIAGQLIAGMDWSTGIVAALTAERLAGAGNRSTRTVSRAVAWLQDAGVLFLIEPGATADYLGGDRNRTPTYAFITNAPLSVVPPDDREDRVAEPEAPDLDGNPQLTSPVDDLGDPPNPRVDLTTRTRRLEQPGPAPTSWPGWQIPHTPAERSAAGHCLLERLGLGPSGHPGRARKINLGRWWAMLKPWWDAGWSPRGLAWAIEHHPDNPAHHRGDALAGATDPVGVLGARLAPWRHRAGELPIGLIGLNGDHHATARAAQLARLTAAAGAGDDDDDQPDRSEKARAAARAVLAARLTANRARRRTRPR